MSSLRGALREDGQSLIYVTLAMLVLLGFVALAIDVGNLYAERRRMQNAADAGALAGARELCLGRAIPTAEAVARKYATSMNPILPGNSNQQAVAVASGSGAGAAMSVTASEMVRPFFGLTSLGIVPSRVGAQAQAGCGGTKSSCGGFPITLEINKFLAVPCGGEIGITNMNVDCPEGYDCSRFFNGATSAQRGWWSPFGDCSTPGLRDGIYGGYLREKISIGECITGVPGAKSGAINSQGLVDWLADTSQNHTVTIPLYNCLGDNPSQCAPCTQHGSGCQNSYRVAGWGCLDITGYVKQADENPEDFHVDSESGNDPGWYPKSVIVAEVNCNCVTNCGQWDGTPTPGNNKALIPVLK